ncbi:hypothetical protein HOLleu_43798 [Holothuria leucospilota]|uniref:Uncharacterized protein n=1 Tax=Holothuria leucospilota TaxID=206669 RepID=A0A9Q1BAU8_HOLLE|nr:hypothetical protein HOLleu_43798 [Holothuria leucospilota]
MDVCVFCQHSLQNDEDVDVVTLRQKGVKGIINATIRNRLLKVAQSAHFVHKLTTSSSASTVFFCGQPAVQKESKHQYFPVKTFEFQKKIESVCEERGRLDEWANHVRGRLALVSDLHAAEAVYHQACSVNFRTHKQIPQYFTNKPQSKRVAGRPEDQNQASAFAKVAKYLKENDDTQATLSDLVNKMKEFCDVPYSTVHMRKKLVDHFGDSIIITEVNGKLNVVTFTNTVWSILQEFYKRPKHQDSESEKLPIITAAGKLVRSDIKLMGAFSKAYTTSKSVTSVDENLDYIPESAILLLRVIMNEKKNTLKVASIGQTLVQAALPRILMAPLQRFEASAAVSQGSHMPKVGKDHVLQFVADNVDHNVRTLDGHGSFHGMGIIAGITPGIENETRVERVSVTGKVRISLGTINISYYTRKQCSLPDLTFKEILDVKGNDPTWKLDFLWKITRPVKSPTPALMIVLNEPDNSDLKTIILCLGGFHLQMRFLGCIGYIMANSGLRELLETIYAANTVNHVLNGKAVARAQNPGYSSKVFKPKLNNHMGDTDQERERGDAAEEMQSVTTATDDQHMVMDEDRASGSQECNDNLLSSVGELYDGLIDKTISPEVVCESTLLDDINHMLEVEKQSLSHMRTGSL